MNTRELAEKFYMKSVNNEIDENQGRIDFINSLAGLLDEVRNDVLEEAAMIADTIGEKLYKYKPGQLRDDYGDSCLIAGGAFDVRNTIRFLKTKGKECINNTIERKKALRKKS